MAKIDTAKRELYAQLKDMSEVIGAGIKGSGKSEYIVVFVNKLTQKVKASIPETFKGIKVKTERKGMAKVV